MKKTVSFQSQIRSISKKIMNKHPNYLRLVDRNQSFINLYETFSTKILTPHIYRKYYYREKLFNLEGILSLLTPTWAVQTVFTEHYIPNNSESVVIGRIQQSNINTNTSQPPNF